MEEKTNITIKYTAEVSELTEKLNEVTKLLERIQELTSNLGMNINLTTTKEEIVTP